jgi:hypothetical protein
MADPDPDSDSDADMVGAQIQHDETMKLLY